jgi:SAM-dependent methyltransferase
MSGKNDTTQTSYDTVAEIYGQQLIDELDGKPLDRQLLERFAKEAAAKGPLCDLGCGPGQIARYLRRCGVEDVFGLDLSPGMVEQARRLNPDILFRQGNMLNLEDNDASWGGIAAFYSIIHIPRPDVVTALRELLRVLRPGGLLLLTFHIGEETIHLDEWWDKPVSVDFHYFRCDEMERYLVQAGFKIVESIERPRYPDVEYQSHRAYIFARKPGG